MVKNTKLLKDCDTKLLELSEKLDNVILTLKDKPAAAAAENSDLFAILDLFVDFPINDNQMLNHVEQILESTESYKKLVSITASKKYTVFINLSHKHIYQTFYLDIYILLLLIIFTFHIYKLCFIVICTFRFMFLVRYKYYLYFFFDCSINIF